MPIVRDAAELHQLEGRVIQVEGRYAVEDLGRHEVVYDRPDGTTGSSNRIALLGIDGDIWLDLWVRPDEEMAALDGKTVRVTGTLIAGRRPEGPGAQRESGPSLIHITDVREVD